MRPISPGPSGGRRKEYASGPAGGFSGLMGRVARVANASPARVGFGGSELAGRSMRNLDKMWARVGLDEPSRFSMEHGARNVQGAPAAADVCESRLAF